MPKTPLKPTTAIAILLHLALPLYSVASDSVHEFAQKNIEKWLPEHKDIGLVLGLIHKGKSQVFNFGQASFDRDTLFEIGSITKVFTALTLAEFVHQQKVALTDPISKYLPDFVKSPTKDSKPIRLIHLASHTSGLPRLPPNMLRLKHLWDRTNPYEGYSLTKLYLGLNYAKLNTTPGKTYAYSNYAFGLLGQLLAGIAKTDYQNLILLYICQPLNMKNTFVHLPDHRKSTLATAHLKSTEKTSNWDMDSLAGAGGIKSSVADLLLFLQEHLDPHHQQLTSAIEMSIKNHHQIAKNSSIGLGWHFKKRYNQPFVWHNGATGGYASFAGFNRKNQTAVVILCNAAVSHELTQTGFQLLENFSK